MAKIKQNNSQQRLVQDELLPNIVVTCVIIGFHEREPKMLLARFAQHGKWMIPSAFVGKSEDLDVVAYHILENKTGIKDMYLSQFGAFGCAKRLSIQERREILTIYRINHLASEETCVDRIISIGYYVFIDTSKVVLQDADSGEYLAWFSLDEIPILFGDDNDIVASAIESIRKNIDDILIYHQLLPEKFTMFQMRSIYEGILGRVLDRRNFERKMMATGYVKLLPEVKEEGRRIARLFSIDKQVYEKRILSGGE